LPFSMQSAALHQLAYDGNLQAFLSMPPDLQRFQSISERGHTVLYSACRSQRTSPQLVSHLIENKGCNVNQPNSSAAAGSFPQHAAVQVLNEAVNGTAAAQLPLASVLLDVLKILKSKGANMALINTQHQRTAYQEFQLFENQMKACPAVAHLVPQFLQVLSAYPPPSTPPPPHPTPGVAAPYYAAPPPSHHAQPAFAGSLPPTSGVAPPYYASAPAIPSGNPPFNKDDWVKFASSKPLPREHIYICTDCKEGVDQGWPPGLMTPTTSQLLHRIGVTETSILIQAAVDLDSETFNTNFRCCFFERTQDTQDALRLFLNGAQASTNQMEYHRRLQIMSQMQTALFGFQPVPFPVIQQAPDSSLSITLKTWDATELQFNAACFTGNIELAKQLLSDHTIDVNAKDSSKNQTHLYAACRGPSCQPAIVELLLRHCASTKVPSGTTHSLPVHALVINFVECTHQGNKTYIPKERFDEYFARISAIVQLLKRYHADFRSMNGFGHSPLSELENEPNESYLPARKHPKYKEFCQLIQDSSAKKIYY